MLRALASWEEGSVQVLAPPSTLLQPCSRQLQTDCMQILQWHIVPICRFAIQSSLLTFDVFKHHASQPISQTTLVYEFLINLTSNNSAVIHTHKLVLPVKTTVNMKQI